MHITLTRYYGDHFETKSTFMVVTDQGAELTGEAREPQFVDYTETFPKCALCCLPTGTFRLKVASSEYSAMSLKVMNAPGHKCCFIGWKATNGIRHNTILIGQSDGDKLPECRKMIRQEETMRMLDKLVYRAFISGDEMKLTVINSICNNEMRTNSKL
ncbi:MAG: hypothetical protein KBT33_03845 [Prevotellaceae bacterium]|nr:hypothetical protein [Candidatus Minthosoma equi]